MNKNLTDTIRVSAIANYLEHQSNPEEDRYVFAYTISIENCGQITARLMTRHWLITDADGGVQEVHGDGVVGEQPYIGPSVVHTYSSGAILTTPVGTMQGSYGMLSGNTLAFDAAIPVFRLAVPAMLN